MQGEPVPKQSFRVLKSGRGGYIDHRVIAWQNEIAVAARMILQDQLPLAGPVSIKIDFILSNRRRVDVDNLTKAVCDALNRIAFIDDTQVICQFLNKYIDRNNPGIRVWILEGRGFPIALLESLAY